MSIKHTCIFSSCPNEVSKGPYYQEHEHLYTELNADTQDTGLKPHEGYTLEVRVENNYQTNKEKVILSFIQDKNRFDYVLHETDNYKCAARYAFACCKELIQQLTKDMTFYANR